MKLGEVYTQLLTFVMLDAFMYYTLPQFLSILFKIFQLLACIYNQSMYNKISWILRSQDRVLIHGFNTGYIKS